MALHRGSLSRSRRTPLAGTPCGRNWSALSSSRNRPWNPWALRHEPAFYARYIAPQIARGTLIDDTEARARAFSWGLMQVMGQVAREQGFGGASLAALCDPAKGLDVGCRLLAAKLAAAEGNVTRALALWNGGANPDYANAVLARAAHYAAS